MSALALVSLGIALLVAFAGGLAIGCLGELAHIRRLERALLVPLPDEAVTR